MAIQVYINNKLCFFVYVKTLVLDQYDQSCG